MKKIIISILIIIAIFCLWKFVFSRAIKEGSPEDIVQWFIEADLSGARLGGQFGNPSDAFSYTIWQGAPGYDEWMVVSGYSIKETEIKENEAEVEVEFTCLAGNLEYNNEGEAIGIEQCQSEKETVSFSLVKKNDAWKISSPHFVPHISKETAAKFFEANNLSLETSN